MKQILDDVLEDEKMSFKDLYCLKIPVPKVGVIMKELILIATCNPQKLSTYSDEIVLATRMIERLYDYEMSDSNWREAITLIKSFPVVTNKKIGYRFVTGGSNWKTNY